MKDAKNNPITPGTKLRRTVERNGAYVGHMYTVVERIWGESDTEKSLVADGGFISELLDDERSKEFEVV